MADISVNFDKDEDAYHIVIDGLVVYLQEWEVEDLIQELYDAMEDKS